MQSKIKVLFVLLGAYPLFRPGSNLGYGGAEIDLYTIATSLDRSRFEPHFIVGDFGQAKREEIQGVILHKGAKVGSTGGFHALLNIVKLTWLILRIRPDVLFSKGVSWQTIQLMILKLVVRSKLMIKSSHKRNLDGSLQSTAMGKLFARYINLIDVFILQNAEDRETFRHTFPHYSRKLDLVRNAQEIPPYESRSYTKTFLWVGRSEPFKQPEQFLTLARLCPQHHFLMVMPHTNTSLFHHIKVAAKDISNLTFTPGVPRDTMPSYYKKASFLVSTSRNEGFPNVVLESLKYGTPILSFTDYDGLITHHKAGYIVPSAQGLADFITRLDASEWQTMSRHAYALADDHFNLEKNAKKYAELIRQCLSYA